MEWFTSICKHLSDAYITLLQFSNYSLIGTALITCVLLGIFIIT